jgi:VWFA-related protein
MGLGGWISMVLLCGSVAAAAQQIVSAQNPPAPDRDHPTLSHRAAPAKGSMPEGKIKIDVVVTDSSGRPVAGLERKDFTLLDNKKSRPILSFRAVDGVLGAGKSDPPVEVILLIDVTNTDLRVVGNERYQIENFLRRNGGKLAQPTSLMIFDDSGVKGLPQPTRDGNRLADELNKAESTMHSNASHGTD